MSAYLGIVDKEYGFGRHLKCARAGVYLQIWKGYSWADGPHHIVRIYLALPSAEEINLTETSKRNLTVDSHRDLESPERRPACTGMLSAAVSNPIMNREGFLLQRRIF